jgi:nucleoside-diphosphate-sugar epimerase
MMPPSPMGKIVILGCGYVGWVLARRLIARGDPVRATTTTEAKLTELTALGAEPLLLKKDSPDAFKRALESATAVIHLAPPIEGQNAKSIVQSIKQAAGSDLRAYVYGSSTAAFGQLADPNAWVDEETTPKNVSPHGQQRLDFEKALLDSGLPVRVLRIAGIYGPGRTLREQIERDALILFQGQPPTSRIHVEDLVRLLEAMLGDRVPKLVVACDEEPATTLDVARFTCDLLGRQPPEPVLLEDAKRVLSKKALEMRLGGHKCRSLYRERLIGALAYPTYREGVRQSLEAEGALPKR